MSWVAYRVFNSGLCTRFTVAIDLCVGKGWLFNSQPVERPIREHDITSKTTRYGSREWTKPTAATAFDCSQMACDEHCHRHTQLVDMAIPCDVGFQCRVTVEQRTTNDDGQHNITWSCTQPLPCGYYYSTTSTTTCEPSASVFPWKNCPFRYVGKVVVVVQYISALLRIAMDLEMHVSTREHNIFVDIVCPTHKQANRTGVLIQLNPSKHLPACPEPCSGVLLIYLCFVCVCFHSAPAARSSVYNDMLMQTYLYCIHMRTLSDGTEYSISPNGIFFRRRRRCRCCSLDSTRQNKLRTEVRPTFSGGWLPVSPPPSSYVE